MAEGGPAEWEQVEESSGVMHRGVSRGGTGGRKC